MADLPRPTPSPSLSHPEFSERPDSDRPARGSACGSTVRVSRSPSGLWARGVAVWRAVWNQDCGITKCATTVKTRMIGTAHTVRRDCSPSHRFDLGRSSSPTNTVASSADKMPALISDARTGNNCGGHTAGRLAAQVQLGRTGCAIQSTSNPRSTVPTATAGERVAPTVWMGIEPDYRSSTTAARRLRRVILRDNVNQSQRGFPTRSLWRGAPGHRERNTIRGNQALDSPHPPASVSPGFAPPAPQQSAQGFIWFGRRALGHRTTAL